MSADELFRVAAADFLAGKLAQAEISCSHAVSQDPRHAEALHLLGVIAHQLGRTDAVTLMRRAVAAQPDDPAYHNNLGFLLEANGEYAEATRCYQHAAILLPDYADARHHLSFSLLRQGDFSRGWPEYEWRSKTPSFLATHPPHGRPRWDGGELTGRVLLLHAEQGIGDTIQFLRYVPGFLKSVRHPRTLLLCHSALRSLADRNLSRLCTIIAGVHPGDFDVEYALDSLPFYSRTTLETVPQTVPYLAPGREKAAQWQKRLAADGRFKVGLVWAGNKAYTKDRLRSMPLSTLAPLQGVSGVSLYSLQKNDAALQTRDVPGFGLIDHTNELNDFDDTAALVAHLDLVITVDSAVGHLAGAMGKPVWVLLPRVPDWRWMLGRDDSPWYPTARLFRQANATTGRRSPDGSPRRCAVSSNEIVDEVLDKLLPPRMPLHGVGRASAMVSRLASVCLPASISAPTPSSHDA